MLGYGVVAVSFLILGLVLGITLGFLRGTTDREDWMEREIYERDVIIDGLQDELYTLYENPKEIRRRMETIASTGCSFRGDFGRLVDPPAGPCPPDSGEVS